MQGRGETTFLLDGTERTCAHAADAPLLAVLRGDLDVFAARFGCGLEQCGACMVLVDGAPKPSCTLAMDAAAGRRIVTAAGLIEHTQAGRALTDAFEAEQAGQCGYCLAGILVSAAALLERDRDPDRAAIAAALEPHLCRCGAHPRIIRAVLRAAASLPAARASA